MTALLADTSVKLHVKFHFFPARREKVIVFRKLAPMPAVSSLGTPTFPSAAITHARLVSSRLVSLLNKTGFGGVGGNTHAAVTASTPNPADSLGIHPECNRDSG